MKKLLAPRSVGVVVESATIYMYYYIAYARIYMYIRSVDIVNAYYLNIRYVMYTFFNSSIELWCSGVSSLQCQ